MAGKTFVEKIFNALQGSIVFSRPDIILSHDNTASIKKIFEKMGGENVVDPNQLMVVLDHNAPPTNCKLANDYQSIRDFVNEQGITRFHDAGDGICHQLMAKYARPGNIIVGSDSHTCTAGAFNAFAAGVDRTEAAGLWLTGETWFRVPESIKIVFEGNLQKGVYAKDVALYLIGMLGSSGANYMSIEFHGEACRNLSIADRMTITNLASEMGAKNAVFKADSILNDFMEDELAGVWADNDASYCNEYTVNLTDIVPLVACPHHVDNVKTVNELRDTPIQQALIGTCTNGRIEDLREAANILKGNKVPTGFQLLVTPASRNVYMKALNEGLIEIFLQSGANVLSPSCGPCLGTGQGIPADGMNVISTANRNFLGRMGNKKSAIYLASPATVAYSALKGRIENTAFTGNQTFPFKKKQHSKVTIDVNDNRRVNGVWNYSDVDNLNTDQMFAGSLTYEINSSEADKIAPYLFADFDANFVKAVKPNDILLCGHNFGCGSSREHPSVGLAHVGVKVIIVKSVSRIFYRSAVNQGLLILVLPDAVDSYQTGNKVVAEFEKGYVKIGEKIFRFPALRGKVNEILLAGGLINWMKQNSQRFSQEEC